MPEEAPAPAASAVALHSAAVAAAAAAIDQYSLSRNKNVYCWTVYVANAAAAAMETRLPELANLDFRIRVRDNCMYTIPVLIMTGQCIGLSGLVRCNHADDGMRLFHGNLIIVRCLQNVIAFRRLLK